MSSLALGESYTGCMRAICQELDHEACKRGFPTLALCGFLFQCKPFPGHPNHLFMNQSAATERMTAYLQDIQTEI